VLGFGDDPRKFIFVNEMTREEGKVLMAIKDFDLFADQLGLLRLTINIFVDAVKEGVRPDDCVEEQVETAVSSLCTFPHKQILTALKKSPNGVRIRQFDGIKNEGISLSDPREVGVAMKKCAQGAILYHFESMEYRPFSTAHKTALERYTPWK
jgi:hypothetical protein